MMPGNRTFTRTGWVAVLILAGVAACSGEGDTTGPAPPDDEPQVVPSISTIDPSRGPVGTTVTIGGQNFGDAPATGSVAFSNAAATVSSWSVNEIRAVVPDAFPGDYQVTVTVEGESSNAVTFRVTLVPAVYVHNDPRGEPSSVDAWSVDDAGKLTELPGSPFMTNAFGGGYGGDSGSLQIHEATRRAFVSADSTVAVFDIDPRSGALVPVPGSPFAAGTSEPTFGIAVSQAGDLLYLANLNTPQRPPNTSHISIFEVQPDGSLVPHPSSPFDTGVSSAADIALLTPDDRFLYVNTEDLEFLGYSVSPDGGLTQLSGSPYLADPSLMGMAFGARLSPDGSHLLLGYTNLDEIKIYQLDPATGIPSEHPGSPVAAENAHDFAFTLDGRRVYVGAWVRNFVHVFDVAIDGGLMPIMGSPFTLSNIDRVAAIAISADSRFLFVANEPGAVGTTARFAVYALNGAGEPIEVDGSPYPVSVPDDGPSGIAVTF